MTTENQNSNQEDKRPDHFQDDKSFEIRIVTTHKDEPREVIYREEDPHKGIEGKTWGSARAYCFYGDKLVIVRSRGYWQVPGGRFESGETIEQATAREVREEANMRVLDQKFIGYQDIVDPNRTQRNTDSFCVVEPIGPFIADPDLSVTEMKLIDPKDIKEYFDWGPMGDRVLARAIEIKNSRE